MQQPLQNKPVLPHAPLWSPVRFYPLFQSCQWFYFTVLSFIWPDTRRWVKRFDLFWLWWHSTQILSQPLCHQKCFPCFSICPFQRWRRPFWTCPGALAGERDLQDEVTCVFPGKVPAKEAQVICPGVLHFLRGNTSVRERHICFYTPPAHVFLLELPWWHIVHTGLYDENNWSHSTKAIKKMLPTSS